MTLDLIPVSAATKAENWPMPNIKAELRDFGASQYFASLDFFGGQWQSPLDVESYDACGIVAPEETYVSTRFLQA